MKLFEPTILSSHISKWRKILELGELGIVWWFPYSDKNWRIPQLLKDLDDHSIEYKTINLNIDPIDDFEEIRELLSNETQKIIISGAEKLFFDSKQLLDQIIQFNRKNQRGILLLAEMFPLSSDKLIEIDIDLIQNLSAYPLYDKKDAFLFMDFLIQKWSLTIKKEDKEATYAVVGGNPWLIKQVFRDIKINDGDLLTAINSKRLKEKVVILANLLSKRMNFSDDELFTREMVVALKEFNLFLDSSNDLPSHFYKYGFLSDYKSVVLVNDNLMYRNKIINDLFSKSELIWLKFLLTKNEGEVFSREDSGKIIWEDEDLMYEDWSLDQMIYRIRKKIKDERLPIKILTRRGKGYVWYARK